MTRKQQRVAYLLAALATFIVGAFDVPALVAVYQNLRTLTFPSTQGVIRSSSAQSNSLLTSPGQRGSRVRGTRLKLEYLYAVGGLTHTGTQYSFGDLPSNDRWAGKTAASLPVGKRLTVYYDPDDPATSVLRRGLDGDDLYQLLFLTPFNLMALGFWAIATAPLREKRRQASLARRRGRDDGVPVNFGPSPAPLAAILTLLALSLASSILIGLTVGSHPTVTFMTVCWTLLLAVTAGVYLFVWLKHRSDAAHLHMDDKDGLLTLPATYGRVEPLTLRRDSIEAIDVAESPSPTTHPPRYAVLLRYQEGPRSGSETLARFPQKSDADHLASSLRQWLGSDKPANAPTTVPTIAHTEVPS